MHYPIVAPYEKGVVIMAKVPIPSTSQEIKERLKAEYYQKYLELGRPLTVMEVNQDKSMHSWSFYQKHWGTLKKLLTALDLADFYKQNRGKNPMYLDELLLRLLNEKYHRDGVIPTTRSVNADPEMPSAPAYYKHFKRSWADILTLANVPVDRANANHAGLSRQELIYKLQKKAALLGHAPRRREVDADASMPNSKTYQTHFGTYFHALLHAGINPDPAQYHSYFSNLTRVKKTQPD